MTVKDLERRYDYSYWANRKLFSVIAQAPPGHFTKDVAGSYSSIRNTLVHVLSAEWGWLERGGGSARGPALKADDYPTLDSLVARWDTVERQMRAFLGGLADADLARVVEFKNPQGETLSKVALLLRALGHAPGNVDLLVYDAERRGLPVF